MNAAFTRLFGYLLPLTLCTVVAVAVAVSAGVGVAPWAAAADPGAGDDVPGTVGHWQWPVLRPARPGSAGSGGSAAASPGRAPEVTRGFEPPTTPYGPGHRGVDLGSEPGAAVRAAGAGVVTYAGMLAGRGVVALAHAGGLHTTYEPLRPAVRAGQRLDVGALLGTVVAGHPGCPRPACLHWGLRRGHTYLDPLTLPRGGTVRLLPARRGPPPTPVARGPATEPVPATSLSEAVRRGVPAAVGLGVAGALALRRRRGP